MPRDPKGGVLAERLLRVATGGVMAAPPIPRLPVLTGVKEARPETGGGRKHSLGTDCAPDATWWMRKNGVRLCLLS